MAILLLRRPSRQAARSLSKSTPNGFAKIKPPAFVCKTERGIYLLHPQYIRFQGLGSILTDSRLVNDWEGMEENDRQFQHSSENQCWIPCRRTSWQLVRNSFSFAKHPYDRTNAVHQSQFTECNKRFVCFIKKFTSINESEAVGCYTCSLVCSQKGLLILCEDLILPLPRLHLQKYLRIW